MRIQLARLKQKNAARVPQNGPVSVGDIPQSVDFRFRDGSKADLTAFLLNPPSDIDGAGHEKIFDEQGDARVIASSLHPYGGLKGSATFTKWQGSLPDIGFDPHEIVFPTKVFEKILRWPNLPPALAHRLNSLTFDRTEINFMQICRQVGQFPDSVVSDQEKMIFFQQMISKLLHETKYEEMAGDAGAESGAGSADVAVVAGRAASKRGGEYGSRPWSDPEGDLQQAAKRDIDRAIASGAPAEIASFDQSFKLSDFVGNAFGDCRATNLLMAFALKEAGFGGDNDIQIVNVRCARVETLEQIDEIDTLQKAGSVARREIEALEVKIAAGKAAQADVSADQEALTEVKARFYGAKGKPGIKPKLAELAGDHTLIVMKWPPNVEPEQQTLRFADFFYGEMHGLPVSATTVPLTVEERDKLRAGFLENYRIRSFFAEKIKNTQDDDGGSYSKAPYAQLRAFLPYPEVVGAPMAEPANEPSRPARGARWEKLISGSNPRH